MEEPLAIATAILWMRVRGDTRVPVLMEGIVVQTVLRIDSIIEIESIQRPTPLLSLTIEMVTPGLRKATDSTNTILLINRPEEVGIALSPRLSLSHTPMKEMMMDRLSNLLTENRETLFKPSYPSNRRVIQVSFIKILLTVDSLTLIQ